MDQYDLPLAYLNDSIIEPIIGRYEDKLVSGSSKLYFHKCYSNDSVKLCAYHNKMFAKQMYDNCQNEIDSVKQIYLKDVTLGENLDINKLYYKKMNEEYFRIFGFMGKYFTVSNEVFYVRTIFPCLMILLCLVIVLMLHTITRKIQSEYEYIQDIKLRFAAMSTYLFEIYHRDLLLSNNESVHIPDISYEKEFEDWVRNLLDKFYFVESNPDLNSVDVFNINNPDSPVEKRILGVKYFLSKHGFITIMGKIITDPENMQNTSEKGFILPADFKKLINSFPSKGDEYKLNIYITEHPSEEELPATVINTEPGDGGQSEGKSNDKV